MSVMCLVCVLFHGSLYPFFPFYEMFLLSCIICIEFVAMTCIITQYGSTVYIGIAMGGPAL